MKVLIAVQDEVCVKELFAFAAAYPWPEDVEFKVLHVVTPVKVGSFMSLLPSPMLDDITKERAKLGKELVERMATRLKDELKLKATTEEVVDGFPKEEIIEQVKKWNADSIILGSHRRHGAQGFMLGNVTQAVASHAPCSVIVVPLSGKAASGKHDEGDGKEEKLHVII